MKKIIASIFALMTFFSFSTNAASTNVSEKITVFAAASLTNAMQDIRTAFIAHHKEADIALSFASSSVLAKQIEQGAPADIFMSADQKWMSYLLDRKLTDNKKDLLKNGLVLISPLNSTLSNIKIDNKTDWPALLPKNERMAVGDPSHVPAGIYAKESLTNLGVFTQLEPQLAPASNVRDALMLVERNEAVLGIVYSTDAKISSKVKVIGIFPADSFTQIVYPMTLLNRKAELFYDFLMSREAKAIFAKYGFITQ